MSTFRIAQFDNVLLRIVYSRNGKMVTSADPGPNGTVVMLPN